MAHDQKVRIQSFIGQSDRDIAAAHITAAEQLSAWYGEQDLLVFSDGGSVFQFSTAAYAASGLFVFIITVFDTRLHYDKS